MSLAERTQARAELSLRQRLYGSYASSNVGLRTPTLKGLEHDTYYFRHHFLRHLPQDRSAKILDVGCGYGSLVYFLIRQGYRNVIGIDLSVEQVRIASSLGIANIVEGDMLQYLRGRVAELDVVFATDVLEHLNKDGLLEALDAIMSGLKPGGRLILQTANADGPFAGRYRYGDLTHELAFTAESIAQALRIAGFSNIEVYPIEPHVHGVKSGVRWALWRGIRALLVAYLAIETGMVRGHVLSQNLIAVASKPA